MGVKSLLGVSLFAPSGFAPLSWNLSPPAKSNGPQLEWEPTWSGSLFRQQRSFTNDRFMHSSAIALFVVLRTGQTPTGKWLYVYEKCVCVCVWAVM